MSGIRLKLENVSKSFKLPHEQYSSLKQTVLNLHKLRRHKSETLRVLKDINFEVKDGEFFGVVGRNGSGKSTLLKLIAGIYQPTKGSIVVSDRLTPFIELGVGFNMELTGRDNVFLNGAILGLTRKEIEAKYDEIVGFAELEKFMDQKLKNYSSGMQVRLAFSIAIQAHAGILLVDEVLAVGDANFQKKCFEVFKQMKREGKTVVFVSHDMGAVKEYCDQAILIEKGTIVAAGDTESVISQYNQINLALAEEQLTKLNQRIIKNQSHFGSGSVTIENAWAVNKSGRKETVYKPHETIIILCEIIANKAIHNPLISLQCHNPGGPAVFSVNTKVKKFKQDLKKGDHIRLRWEIPNMFNDGEYLVNATVYSEDSSVIHDQVPEAYKFEIRGWEHPHSLTHPQDKLTVTQLR